MEIPEGAPQSLYRPGITWAPCLPSRSQDSGGWTGHGDGEGGAEPGVAWESQPPNALLEGGDTGLLARRLGLVGGAQPWRTHVRTRVNPGS